MKENIRIPRIKKGDRVFWLDPARAQDGMECCREYEVTERKASMLLLDDRIEALHKECYLKSEYCCPRCGRPLYYEKSYNTKNHYPLICFDCDENFYTVECCRDLSYGLVAELEARFDRYFKIDATDEDEYNDLYTQALVTFENDWREGNVRDEQEFFDTYGGEYNHLKLVDDIWYEGLNAGDRLYAATMGNPMEGVMWTAEQRDNAWKAMSIYEKHRARFDLPGKKKA